MRKIGRNVKLVIINPAIIIRANFLLTIIKSVVESLTRCVALSSRLKRQRWVNLILKKFIRYQLKFYWNSSVNLEKLVIGISQNLKMVIKYLLWNFYNF